MLKIINIALLVKYLQFVDEDSTVDKVGESDSKIDEAKSVAKKKSKSAKSQNMIQLDFLMYLAILLIES